MESVTVAFDQATVEKILSILDKMESLLKPDRKNHRSFSITTTVPTPTPSFCDLTTNLSNLPITTEDDAKVTFHDESTADLVLEMVHDTENEEELKKDGLELSSATSSFAPKISGAEDTKKLLVEEDNVSDSVSNLHQAIKEKPIPDLVIELDDEQRANDVVASRSRSCFSFILGDLRYEFMMFASTTMVPTLSWNVFPPPEPPDRQLLKASTMKNVTQPNYLTSSSLNLALLLTTTPKSISNQKLPSSLDHSQRRICIAPPPSHFLPSDLYSLGNLRCFDPGGPLSLSFLPLPPVSISGMFASYPTSIASSLQNGLGVPACERKEQGLLTELVLLVDLGLVKVWAYHLLNGKWAYGEHFQETYVAALIHHHQNT